MTDKVKQLAVMAGLIAPHGSDHEGLSNFDWRFFAELIVRNCIAQCRDVSYSAMEIELDRNAPTIEYDRGNKSGRKFGAINCAQKLAETYNIKP